MAVIHVFSLSACMLIPEHYIHGARNQNCILSNVSSSYGIKSFTIHPIFPFCFSPSSLFSPPSRRSFLFCGLLLRPSVFLPFFLSAFLYPWCQMLTLHVLSSHSPSFFCFFLLYIVFCFSFFFLYYRIDSTATTLYSPPKRFLLFHPPATLLPLSPATRSPI